MQVKKIYMREFLEEKNIFKIPLYQRKYKWTRKECEKLLKDIRNFSKEKDIQHYFIGSMIAFSSDLKNKNGYFDYTIVDGQQRLITFALLFYAIYDFVKENESKYDMPIKSEQIYRNILHNYSDKGELEDKFLLHSTDITSLKNVFDNNAAKDGGLLERNYYYFRNAISFHKSEFIEIFEAINRVTVLIVSLTEGRENPQLIYETINSSGVELRITDMCKNLLLMNMSEEDQFYYYENYWIKISELLGEHFDVFIQHYMSMKRKDKISKQDIYDEFRNYSQGKDKKDLIEDIWDCVEEYQKIIEGWHEIPEISDKIKFLSQFDLTVSYPFLLELLLRLKRKEITLDNAEKTLHFLESYFVRRFICGLASQGLNDTFCRILKKMNSQDMLKDITEHFSINEYRTWEYPDKSKIEEGLYKPLYGTVKKNKIIKSILLRIEEVNGVGYLEPNKLSIEHIVPQTLTVEWKDYLGQDLDIIFDTYLHSLSNLTLTGYNSELSNRSFKDKKEVEGGFNNSLLFLNRKISTYQCWNVSSMEDYGHFLLEEIDRIWPSLERRVL